MSTAALAALLASRQVWQGHAAPAADGEPSGWPALDALLPGGGWPKAALSTGRMELIGKVFSIGDRG